MKLKLKLERLIMDAFPSRPSCCELSTLSLRSLEMECGFKPVKPPAKQPGPSFFMGVRLQVNDELPAGELRIK